MSVMLVIFMAMICSTAMALPAFAAEHPGVSIPAAVSLSGTLPGAAEEFTVVLKADDAAYPMPEGAENGIYSMTITGEGTKKFPTMTYSKVGVYTYTIYQAAGNNESCTYDDRVYTLTVYVTNAEDGSGLETSAVLYPDSKGDKLPSAEFENAYEVVPSTPAETEKPTAPSDSPKTGDESTPILYGVLIMISLGVLAALLMAPKRKRQKISE